MENLFLELFIGTVIAFVCSFHYSRKRYGVIVSMAVKAGEDYQGVKLQDLIFFDLMTDDDRLKRVYLKSHQQEEFAVGEKIFFMLVPMGHQIKSPENGEFYFELIKIGKKTLPETANSKDECKLSIF